MCPPCTREKEESRLVDALHEAWEEAGRVWGMEEGFGEGESVSMARLESC